MSGECHFGHWLEARLEFEIDFQLSIPSFTIDHFDTYPFGRMLSENGDVRRRSAPREAKTCVMGFTELVIAPLF